MCKRAACKGLAAIATNALEQLAARCDVIHVDFDIDVIERNAMPSAPGARPAAWPRRISSTQRG